MTDILRTSGLAALAAALIFAPRAAPAQSYNLTGMWRDNNAVITRVRQIGNDVYWGHSEEGTPHIFWGIMSGNMIVGHWVDLPGNPNLREEAPASLLLRVESNDHFVGVVGSRSFGAREWVRVGAAPGQVGWVAGDWDIRCCNDGLYWTLTISRVDGSTFSGSFSAVNGGGVVTNGQIRGSTIDFDRSGPWGSQHWSAQLVNDGGRLRMINGTWTGSGVDSYPGQNNWHAEKR